MSAIIRDGFKVNTLKTFIASLGTDSLYLGIARPQFWDTISQSDTSIPVPQNTISSLNSDWEDMLALKKVTSTNLYTGIFKETWQANVKYDTYRHDWNGTRTSVYNGSSVSVTTPSSLSDVKCYVVTASYNIYLCLKQQISNSVVQPSIYSPETGTPIGTNTGIVKTADGYYWKFIGQTSSGDIVKFSSKYYHPITTVLSAPAPADPYYTQWNNQQYSKTLKGGIYVINVLTVGTGYNGGIAGTRNVVDAEGDTEFKVIGDGIGLQFTVSYGSAGSITDIEVTNPGSGYTHASIVASTGVGATFDVIFTPQSGLGADPVKDLVSRYLLISMTLTGNEGGDFTTTNDFRKIELILNPYNFGTSTVATSATLNSLRTLNVGTGLASSNYPVDSIVTGSISGAKGRVVDFNTVTGNIRIIRTSSENYGNLGANNSFTTSDTLTSNGGPGASAIISITQPEVEKYSGTLLYSEYRSPILRGDVQTEDIKIVVKF